MSQSEHVLVLKLQQHLALLEARVASLELQMAQATLALDAIHHERNPVQTAKRP